MDAIKLLGSLMGNNATGGNLLGSLLGGSGGGGGGGGLGALAGLLGGGGQSQGQSQSTNAPTQASAGGGLGALTSMMGGGGGSSAGGLGSLLSGLAGGGAPEPAPQKEQNDAVLLIKSMCNAAKADGQIDQNEVQNIVSKLGEIDQAEAQFLQQELKAPLDLESFLQTVPDDMTEQVYAFSLMGMKLDTQREAQYLGAVAQGLRMNTDVANQIHAKLGAPQIFK